MKDKEKRVKIVYKGRRLCNDGKIGYFFQVLGTEEQIAFSKKPKKLILAIGIKYEVTRTDEGIQSPYNYEGNLSDDERQSMQVSEWQVKDGLAQDELDILRDSKKIPNDRFAEIKKDISYLISDLTPRQRKIFLMKLVVELY